MIGKNHTKISEDLTLMTFDDANFFDILQDNPEMEFGFEGISITKEELVQILSEVENPDYFLTGEAHITISKDLTLAVFPEANFFDIFQDDEGLDLGFEGITATKQELIDILSKIDDKYKS